MQSRLRLEMCPPMSAAGQRIRCHLGVNRDSREVGERVIKSLHRPSPTTCCYDSVLRPTRVVQLSACACSRAQEVGLTPRIGIAIAPGSRN